MASDGRGQDVYEIKEVIERKLFGHIKVRRRGNICRKNLTRAHPTSIISGPLLRRPSPGPKPDLPAKPDLRQRAAKKRLLILGGDDDKVPRQEYIDGKGNNNNEIVTISPSRSAKNALDDGVIQNEEKSGCSRGKGKPR